jgi:hypothetical protein
MGSKQICGIGHPAHHQYVSNGKVDGCSLQCGSEDCKAQNCLCLIAFFHEGETVSQQFSC